MTVPDNTTAANIRAVTDDLFPRTHPDGSINAQHVAYESTLRGRAGLPGYIADLDGPGRFRAVGVSVEEAAAAIAAGTQPRPRSDTGTTTQEDTTMPNNDKPAAVSYAVPVVQERPGSALERAVDKLEKQLTLDAFGNEQALADALADTNDSELAAIVARTNMSDIRDTIVMLHHIEEEHYRRGAAVQTLRERFTAFAEQIIRNAQDDMRSEPAPRASASVAR